jgi:hypothetical protein
MSVEMTGLTFVVRHGSNQGDKTKENIREWQSRINRLLLPPKEKTNLRNVYANQLFV